MPINYHVKKSMHCSNLDPALQDSIQGCRYEREKIPEFKPMNRVKGGSSNNRGSSNVSSKAKKPTVSSIQEIEPIIPVTLGRTSNVQLPTNNNGFSVFSNQPTLAIKQETNNNQDTNNKKKDSTKTPSILKPQEQLTKPRPITEFENFGSKGKLIDIAYQVDKEIQNQIERADIDYHDKEGRRNVEEAIFEQYENDFEYMMEKAGLGDWKIDAELSTKSHLVLNNGNETQIFFRGRAGNQDLIPGEEGKFKNVFEKILAGEGDRAGTDTRHVIETLGGKKRDYSYIDDLHSKIKEKYPNSNLEVISYSDGGPKGNAYE